MKSLKLFLTSTFFMFLLTSCTSINDFSISDTPNTSKDFIDTVSEMVNSSYKKISRQIEKEDVILVSNFVNVDKLQNNSQLGFLLSEALKNSLSSKNIIIKEIELRKNFKFGKQGLRVLSRNAKDINSESVSERFAMVGTYSITEKRLILFIKLIDLNTGNILNSSSASVIRDKEISRLEYTGNTTRDIYQPLTL